MTQESKVSLPAPPRPPKPGDRAAALAVTVPRGRATAGFGSHRVLQNRGAPAQLSLFQQPPPAR